MGTCPWQQRSRRRQRHSHPSTIGSTSSTWSVYLTHTPSPRRYCGTGAKPPDRLRADRQTERMRSSHARPGGWGPTAVNRIADGNEAERCPWNWAMQFQEVGNCCLLFLRTFAIPSATNLRIWCQASPPAAKFWQGSITIAPLPISVSHTVHEGAVTSRILYLSDGCCEISFGHRLGESHALIVDWRHRAIITQLEAPGWPACDLVETGGILL